MSEPVDYADAQAPNAIEDATVTFADGTRAQYSTVEMLPDGTLKASLRQRFPVFDDQRSYDVEVTDVAYYSPNTWLSVQPPPHVVLVAIVTDSDSGDEDLQPVAYGITEKAAPERIRNGYGIEQRLACLIVSPSMKRSRCVSRSTRARRSRG